MEDERITACLRSSCPPECSNTRKRGFTLIELLIVVAIIAILAAIAVPNFLHAEIRAKVARSLADMHSLGVAIESFRADWGLDLLDNWDRDDPAEVNKYRQPGLEQTISNLRTMQIDFNVLTTPTGYIKSLPQDPFLIYHSAAEAQAAGVSAYAIQMIANLGGTYMYADHDGHEPAADLYDNGIGALYPNVAPSLGLRPLGVGQWVLLGVGPDNRPADFAHLDHRGIPYDPSNGLKSQGDITVRSDGTAMN